MESQVRLCFAAINCPPDHLLIRRKMLLRFFSEGSLSANVRADEQKPHTRLKSPREARGRTKKITDTAPLALNMERQRYRGVRCIRLLALLHLT